MSSDAHAEWVDQLLKLGVAPIKKQFVVSYGYGDKLADRQGSVRVEKKKKSYDRDGAQLKSDRQKKRESKHAGRGLNVGRTVFFAPSVLHPRRLCHRMVAGQPCTFPQGTPGSKTSEDTVVCCMSHDIRLFLERKPQCLGPRCAWDQWSQGSCPFGLNCAFAASHRSYADIMARLLPGSSPPPRQYAQTALLQRYKLPVPQCYPYQAAGAPLVLSVGGVPDVWVPLRALFESDMLRMTEPAGHRGNRKKKKRRGKVNAHFDCFKLLQQAPLRCGGQRVTVCSAAAARIVEQLRLWFTAKYVRRSVQPLRVPAKMREWDPCQVAGRVQCCGQDGTNGTSSDACASIDLERLEVRLSVGRMLQASNRHMFAGILFPRSMELLRLYNQFMALCHHDPFVDMSGVLCSVQEARAQTRRAGNKRSAGSRAAAQQAQNAVVKKRKTKQNVLDLNSLMGLGGETASAQGTSLSQATPQPSSCQAQADASQPKPGLVKSEAKESVTCTDEHGPGSTSTAACTDNKQHKNQHKKSDAPQSSAASATPVNVGHGGAGSSPPVEQIQPRLLECNPYAVMGFADDVQLRKNAQLHDLPPVMTLPAPVSATKHSGLAATLSNAESKQMRDTTHNPTFMQGKLVLAPLTTVGHVPFRRLCCRYGCEVTIGQMALGEQLAKGMGEEWKFLDRHPEEKLFGVQVACNSVVQGALTAELIGQMTAGAQSAHAYERGLRKYMAKLARNAPADPFSTQEDNHVVDFVDLNVSCPIDMMCERSLGAGLMLRRHRLQDVVRSMRAVLPSAMPMSVKMRKAYDKKIDAELYPKGQPRASSTTRTIAQWNPPILRAFDGWRRRELLLRERGAGGGVVGTGGDLGFSKYRQILQQSAYDLVGVCLSSGVSCVSVHGRTRTQRYSKGADYQFLRSLGLRYPGRVIANGDIYSWEDVDRIMHSGRTATTEAAVEEDVTKEETEGGGDSCSNPLFASVMVGRGALIKPWLFREIHERKVWDISASERFDMLRQFTGFGLDYWGSDQRGVDYTRRYLLELLSFTSRYVPVGLLERVPVRMGLKPPVFVGRNDLETLMGSRNPSDWIKISEMLLGPVHRDFYFTPKHKSNAYAPTAESALEMMREQAAATQ